MLPRLAVYTQRYHEYYHLIFGLLAVISASFITHLPPISLLLPSILGVYFPDLDHFLFIFVYGRHTRYGRTTAHLLRNFHISAYIAYVRAHHKTNYGIISHNLLSPLACIFLANFFIPLHPYLTAFFISCSFHFLFDIVEDMINFGYLNPNWYFRFNTQTA